MFPSSRLTLRALAASCLLSAACAPAPVPRDPSPAASSPVVASSPTTEPAAPGPAAWVALSSSAAPPAPALNRPVTVVAKDLDEVFAIEGALIVTRFDPLAVTMARVVAQGEQFVEQDASLLSKELPQPTAERTMGGSQITCGHITAVLGRWPDALWAASSCPVGFGHSVLLRHHEKGWAAVRLPRSLKEPPIGELVAMEWSSARGMVFGWANSVEGSGGHPSHALLTLPRHPADDLPYTLRPILSDGARSTLITPDGALFSYAWDYPKDKPLWISEVGGKRHTGPPPSIGKHRVGSLIAARSAHDVWAVAETVPPETIVSLAHFDGKSWSLIPTQISGTGTALNVADDGTLFLVVEDSRRIILFVGQGAELSEIPLTGLGTPARLLRALGEVWVLTNDSEKKLLQVAHRPEKKP